MLIINADDYGKTRGTTEKILLCHKNDRITSATAMMFMADTERAADLALESRLDVGLHLNLSDQFTGNHHSLRLKESHARVSGFLNRHKWSMLFYNPLLKNDFEYTFKSQWDRFLQLYGKPPSHVDGHRHRHLCFNAILGGVIPAGIKIRRNFHFESGEKGFLNRLYRSTLDRHLTRKYQCTDYFFSIRPLENGDRIREIGKLSLTADVELMVHPEVNAELAFLMSDEFPSLLSGVCRGTYSMLNARSFDER